MAFYQVNLAIFATGAAILVWLQYMRSQGHERSKATSTATSKATYPAKSADEDSNPLEVGTRGHVSLCASEDASATARQFQREFYVVYALAVAADWLQGPHMYAMYRFEKDLPEKLVAVLYATGFVSAALSAPFAGELADRYGRRLACQVYCVTYTLACLSMISNNLMVLLLGRLFGGVSTTLLFSVFEAWMITDYHRRGLEDEAGGGDTLPLGTVFAHLTTISSTVAVLSGVLSDMLVTYLASRVWPFMASIVCCCLAWCLMRVNWRENYGVRSTNTYALTDIGSGIATIMKNRQILSLGIASCVFESSMYLFVFFWSAALEHARKASVLQDIGMDAGAQVDTRLPFGLIFSSFMCAMLTGSSVFSLSLASSGPARDMAASMLMLVLVMTSIGFSGSALLEHSEKHVFWAMCLIEACAGAYFPSISMLKSKAVEDGNRGRIYSLLRVPTNIIVVLAHAMDEEGAAHRNHVFLSLAGSLVVAFLVFQRHFV